jgi:hypothetical protein
MKTRAILLLSLLASSSEAATLEELIAQTNSLVAAFDSSIQIVGGMNDVALGGQVVPVGASDAALISEDIVAAYNNALDFSNPGAQEWLTAQADQKIEELDNAVINFTYAAAPLIEAVEVGSMAASATTVEQEVALEDFIVTNNVEITSVELVAYNDSVVAVESAAATAAAYITASSSQSFVESADAQAYDFRVQYSEVATETFNRDTSTIEISFMASTVSLGLGNYIASIDSIFSTGLESSLYLTGPTQNSCFFTGETCE